MTIIYAINHILEAVLLYYYTFSLYPHIRNRYKDMLAVGIGYSFLFAVFMFKFFSLNILVQLCVFIVLFLLLTHNGIWQCIHDSVLTVLIISLSELMFDIPTVLFHQETAFEYPSVPIQLLALIVQRAIHLILLKSVLYIKRRNQGVTKTKTEEILSTLLLIVCTTATISIQELGFISVLSRDQIPWVFVILFSIVSLSVGALFSLSLLQKKQSELITLRNELQRAEDEENYEKIVHQLDEDQRILIHDFRKHLQIIQENIKINDLHAATDHISELTESNALSGSTSLTRNHTLSVLLSRYQTLCKEQGISLAIDVKDADLDYLPPADITSLFCNLIDNAMEACSLSDEPGIILHINRDDLRSSDIITLINTCKSSPEFERSGFLSTQKKDKARHGFGMKSIQRVVDRYHGTLDLQYLEEDSLFQVTICLYSEES